MKDITLEVLKAIRSDLGAFRKDMDAFRSDMHAFRNDVDAQFAGVDERLDNLAHRQVDSEVLQSVVEQQ